jgi:hypothetical protein
MHEPTKQQVPWQIWVVVALLGLEGVGNLLSAPIMPIHLWWLAMKCVFILGLIKAWRAVFILFEAIAGLHVVAFLTINIVASFLNLVLIALVASCYRYFWPETECRPTVVPEEQP